MERPPMPAGAGGGGATGGATGTGTSKPNKRRNNVNNKRRKERFKSNSNKDNSNSNSNPGTTKNRNNNGTHSSNSNAPKGPPQAPQIKVTIRNIQNAELNGTAQQVIDGLIRTLVERANEKMPVDQKMELVQSNLEQVIMLEQAVLLAKQEAELQAKKELEEKQRQENPEANEDDDGEEQAPDEEQQQQDNVESPTEDAKEAKVEEATTAAAATGPAAVIPAMQNLWISEKSSKHSSTSAPTSAMGIATRVLYICPPKKTRRRGEKPGCAYLLLTAPTIEAQPSVPAAIVENGETKEGTPPASLPAPAEIDYTQEVTRRRLQLQLAVESMTNYAVDNAKGKHDLAGCVVEESLDNKTWKTIYRPYRQTGVIEETADYKEFLERTEKEKEERSARPKPPPGGSTAASVALTASDNGGQPMAALVLHLRAMHDEQSKRNKAKRKGRDAGKAKQSKGGGGKEQDGGNGGGGGGNGGGGSKQQKDGAKKNNKSRKKKKPANKPAPKVLKGAAASGGGSSGAPSSTSAWNKG
jgi:uncharacterized membrane protein YgcG